MAHFGDFLRRLARARGLESDRAISGATGVSTNTLNRLYKLESPESVQQGTRKNLAQGFGLSLSGFDTCWQMVVEAGSEQSQRRRDIREAISGALLDLELDDLHEVHDIVRRRQLTRLLRRNMDLARDEFDIIMSSGRQIGHT